MSQKSLTQNNQIKRDLPLRLHQLKKGRTTPIYFSKRHSQQNSINAHNQGTRSKKKSRNSSLNKTINVLALDKDLIKSLKLVTMRRLKPNIDVIKKYCQQVISQNSRENRYKLVEVLQEIHPFFSKIHATITEAIVLLGKAMIYYKGQLIFDTINQEKSYPSQQINGRSKQDLGFVLYGKLELVNDRQFYSHHLTNSGTIFQDKFINRADKNPYFVSVCQPSFVLWLSKQSYYVIRKQCFLTLDLKYKFGQFQNLLKYNMVSKNLLDCPKI